ncbi:uncharacterized protein BDR25DRAFT_316170 [Lindgomyces ingoldianus]|uniref:Uncharacterized protein n=1 Tax=Lindgomyces ingoldianus TaxID=673940 RepID=A0ACB6QPA2_9PLEO|nr:uncharacterized protein BDR25DRAFT_316170 [Lindgomyces ingoldianus]KAF2468398.1 hypothetical protein BDR25DRAFT_316170 [Lindgomyces ingoldianus]
MISVRKAPLVPSGTDAQADTCCLGVRALTGYWCAAMGYTGVAIYEKNPGDQSKTTTPSFSPTSSPAITTPSIISGPNPTSSPSSPISNPTGSPPGGTAKTGIIVGGVIGGIAIIGIVAVVIIILLRRNGKTPDVSAQHNPPAPNNFQPSPGNSGGYVVAATLQDKTPMGYTAPEVATPLNQASDPLASTYYGASTVVQSPVEPGGPAPQYQPRNPVPEYSPGNPAPFPGQEQRHVPAGWANEMSAVRH